MTIYNVWITTNYRRISFAVEVEEATTKEECIKAINLAWDWATDRVSDDIIVGCEALPMANHETLSIKQVLDMRNCKVAALDCTSLNEE